MGHCKPPKDIFHYVKKQAISFIFNKLRKVDPSCVNHNRNKELKDKDGVQLMERGLHPIHITGNKGNMQAERQRES